MCWNSFDLEAELPTEANNNISIDKKKWQIYSYLEKEVLLRCFTISQRNDNTHCNGVAQEKHKATQFS